jgi:hypothetical protein
LVFARAPLILTNYFYPLNEALGVQMNEVTYSDRVTPVNVGDSVVVTIKKFVIFKRKVQGKVTYVYDSSKESAPHINDVGVNIEISSEKHLFFGLINNRLSSSVVKHQNT